MYAVELVNINGVGFSPFAKMMRDPNQNSGFAKASIITDDDRCSSRESPTYISKDLDFNDDLTEIPDKIERGTPSDRYLSIAKLCTDNIVKCFGSVKTFEYTLALEPNNIPYMLDAIVSTYPIAGSKLKEKVDETSSQQLKALMIWLFVRSRNSAKAQVAQALGRILQTQLQSKENGETLSLPFIVPQYIKDAIYNVTREAPFSEE